LAEEAIAPAVLGAGAKKLVAALAGKVGLIVGVANKRSLS
jgi:hypothetical protein